MAEENKLDVNEIKRYNQTLREYKERSAKLKAEIEFNTGELNRLCKELSDELKIEVTHENIDEIYKDRVSKINNTLEVGKEILQRIVEEEKEHRERMVAEIKEAQKGEDNTGKQNIADMIGAEVPTSIGEGQNNVGEVPEVGVQDFISAEKNRLSEGKKGLFANLEDDGSDSIKI